MKQPGQFNCPQCGAPFSAADVDAAQNTVTCGSCGHAVPWNSLVRENESPAPLPTPPRHLTVQKEDGKITLTYRHSRFKVLLSLGFALVWGLITLFLLRLSLGPAKTDFALPVFTTFFAVSEAFIIFICVDMLLGKVVVRAEPGRGALFRGHRAAGLHMDLPAAHAGRCGRGTSGRGWGQIPPHLHSPALRAGPSTSPEEFQNRTSWNTSPSFCAVSGPEAALFRLISGS